MRPSILYRKKMRNPDQLSTHDELSHIIGQDCVSIAHIATSHHTSADIQGLVKQEVSKPNKHIKL